MAPNHRKITFGSLLSLTIFLLLNCDPAFSAPSIASSYSTKKSPKSPSYQTKSHRGEIVYKFFEPQKTQSVGKAKKGVKKVEREPQDREYGYKGVYDHIGPPPQLPVPGGYGKRTSFVGGPVKREITYDVGVDNEINNYYTDPVNDGNTGPSHQSNLNSLEKTSQQQTITTSPIGSLVSSAIANSGNYGQSVTPSTDSFFNNVKLSDDFYSTNRAIPEKYLASLNSPTSTYDDSNSGGNSGNSAYSTSNAIQSVPTLTIEENNSNKWKPISEFQSQRLPSGGSSYSLSSSGPSPSTHVQPPPIHLSTVVGQSPNDKPIYRLIPKASVEVVPLPPPGEYNVPEIIHNGDHIVRVEKVPLRSLHDAYYNAEIPEETQSATPVMRGNARKTGSKLQKAKPANGSKRGRQRISASQKSNANKKRMSSKRRKSSKQKDEDSSTESPEIDDVEEEVMSTATGIASGVGKQIPGVGGILPGTGTGGIPGVTGLIPGSTGGIPGLSGLVPGATGGIPGAGGLQPGLTGGIPGVTGLIPGSTGGIPGLSGLIPGSTGGIPGAGGLQPGLTGGIPGLSGLVPGSTGGIPGLSGLVPGAAGGQIPGVTGLIPGTVAGAVDQGRMAIGGVATTPRPATDVEDEDEDTETETETEKEETTSAKPETSTTEDDVEEDSETETTSEATPTDEESSSEDSDDEGTSSTTEASTSGEDDADDDTGSSDEDDSSSSSTSTTTPAPPAATTTPKPPLYPFPYPPPPYYFPPPGGYPGIPPPPGLPYGPPPHGMPYPPPPPYPGMPYPPPPGMPFPPPPPGMPGGMPPGMPPPGMTPPGMTPGMPPGMPPPGMPHPPGMPYPPPPPYGPPGPHGPPPPNYPPYPAPPKYGEDANYRPPAYPPPPPNYKPDKPVSYTYTNTPPPAPGYPPNGPPSYPPPSYGAPPAYNKPPYPRPYPKDDGYGDLGNPPVRQSVEVNMPDIVKQISVGQVKKPYYPKPYYPKQGYPKQGYPKQPYPKQGYPKQPNYPPPAAKPQYPQSPAQQPQQQYQGKPMSYYAYNSRRHDGGYPKHPQPPPYQQHPPPPPYQPRPQMPQYPAQPNYHPQPNNYRRNDGDSMGPPPSTDNYDNTSSPPPGDNYEQPPPPPKSYPKPAYLEKEQIANIFTDISIGDMIVDAYPKKEPKYPVNEYPEERPHPQQNQGPYQQGPPPQEQPYQPQNQGPYQGPPPQEQHYQPPQEQNQGPYHQGPPQNQGPYNQGPDGAKTPSYIGQFKNRLKDLLPKLRPHSGDAYPPKLNANYQPMDAGAKASPPSAPVTPWNLGESEVSVTPPPILYNCNENRIGKCVLPLEHTNFHQQSGPEYAHRDHHQQSGPEYGQNLHQNIDLPPPKDLNMLMLDGPHSGGPDSGFYISQGSQRKEVKTSN